jgi:hypothetical protein
MSAKDLLPIKYTKSIFAAFSSKKKDEQNNKKQIKNEDSSLDSKRR